MTTTDTQTRRYELTILTETTQDEAETAIGWALAHLNQPATALLKWWDEDLKTFVVKDGF